MVFKVSVQNHKIMVHIRNKIISGELQVFCENMEIQD